MSIFDVFGGGASEQERNWVADESPENKAVSFNIGDYPEIQKYLQEKGSPELIGDKAETEEGMLQQRAAMEELTQL